MSELEIDCAKIDPNEPRKMLVRNYCFKCSHFGKSNKTCNEDCPVGRVVTELCISMMLTEAKGMDGDADEEP